MECHTYDRQVPTLQSRVKPWMLACFGEAIANDCGERNHRFLEEALELVQSLGCTPSEAHQLVDYVFGRPVGEPHQEVGGVMITLAALCLANTLDMHDAGEDELERIWTKIEQIRAKQAAKPKNSPLPEAQKSRPVLLTDEDFFQEIEIAGIPVEDVALACAIKDLVQSVVLRTSGFNDRTPGDAK